MGRLWRVHQPGVPPTEGSTLALDPRESHHLLRVLRLRPGDALALFDGRGHEWRAVVEGTEGGIVVVRVGPRIEEPVVEPPVTLWLFQALLKIDRMEWVLQKATEIGVARVVVLRTARSEAYPLGPGRLERWRRVIVESCKQSGRRRVPEIEAPEVLAAPAPPGVALLLDPGASGQPIDRLLTPVAPPAVWLLSGPEGGFEAEEVRSRSEEGWQPVGLGPRVLRADTAGIVAAAIVLHRWGDLGV